MTRCDRCRKETDAASAMARNSHSGFHRSSVLSWLKPSRAPWRRLARRVSSGSGQSLCVVHGGLLSRSGWSGNSRRPGTRQSDAGHIIVALPIPARLGINTAAGGRVPGSAVAPAVTRAVLSPDVRVSPPGRPRSEPLEQHVPAGGRAREASGNLGSDPSSLWQW